MADIEADVIIVGSGIAGALLAARLAVAGVKVAILEAGARVDRAQATQRFWDASTTTPGQIQPDPGLRPVGVVTSRTKSTTPQPSVIVSIRAGPSAR
jgi:choline dehydrogenase-like flavoprotein